MFVYLDCLSISLHAVLTTSNRWQGKVGCFTTSRTRFRPMCSHLLMNLFIRQIQELLLPEQPAAAYAVSGLTTSHKWHLEFAGHCKEHHLMPKHHCS